ncbi:hypothetical protein Tsubulata_019863 [Turnera subulata]|uniref:Helicase-like transcription factor CHR28 n=1 Tax=Turnera subulata TaxID=218843 RepID=A0A9Q0GIW5_9ROSI|nr:hypothetical protein Tsubulata_019863 [Turnera subulata]
MEDGSSGALTGGEIEGTVGDVDDVDGGLEDGEEHMSIDLATFMHILEESSDPSQDGLHDDLVENLEVGSHPGAGDHENLPPQSGFQMPDQPCDRGIESAYPVGFYPSCNPEAFDATVGGTDVSYDGAVDYALGVDSAKLETSPQVSSPLQAYSPSIDEWCSRDHGREKVGVSQSDLPSCSTPSFEGGGFDHMVDCNLQLGGYGAQSGSLEGQIESKDACGAPMDSWDEKFASYGAVMDNSLGVSTLQNDITRSMDADASSRTAIPSKSTSCHNSGVTGEVNADYSAVPFSFNPADAYLSDYPYYYSSGVFNPGTFPSDIIAMAHEVDDIGRFQNRSGSSVSQTSMIDYSTVKWPPSETVSEVVDGNYSCSEKDNISVDDDLNQSSSGGSCATQNLRHAVYTAGETVAGNIGSTKARIEGIAGRYPAEQFPVDLNLNASELHLSYVQPSNMSSRLLSKGRVHHPEGYSSHISIVSPESIQSNGSKSHVDDDPDLYILEDISQPAPVFQSLTPKKPIQAMHRTLHSDSVHPIGTSGTKLKTTDERIIFQAALQDLSQPNSEASPPDGVLAVPLLRHQRIALSWMIQKETSGFHCSGGILADDQGLGKTVSTIALILTERASLVDSKVVKKEVSETLNLDGDVDIIEIDGKTKHFGSNQEVDGKTIVLDNFQDMPNHSSSKRVNSFTQSKGRPAAGTLVVCPTSVLRQWADELQKKVTSEANLTVFVYHGANRTKDPWELAKYDVVLTTYSIVSMEVPKQSSFDEDDEEKGKKEGGDVSLLGLTFGKKRKYPPSSGKKASKSKKKTDSVVPDSVARPLAKVRWFRVVLDEAQSIKNYRTQVARACWGLRAKRRWCLSGTPVQNAIDDLYSYFRFLRYDPYSVYNSFCSTIKLPIQRNPTKGYIKLQAVLKTIMLRRTKGTLLDGQPIVKLPPKTVELKKVEFTEEERDFYTRLEADSRAQFKEYADAGTVKQNYVNILLMLLRLRQACDHPLLVRGVDTSSLGKSSIEMAKKLPREKQICLRNCLEASLAICGICSDPPEDAVVSVCGHVFCNQCICEHLCEDEKECPSSNCKVHLRMSSVFSKATLNSSLSDQPIQESSGSELVKAINSYSEDRSFDSSKIKAALEVLQALSKPQDCTSLHSLSENSFGESANRLDNSADSQSSIDESIDKGDTSTKVVGEKAIVFSQWTRMLDLLEARLKSCSIPYRRLDGTMSVVARDKAVKDFNTLPEVSVMIMSLKAASLGLNMVAACRVLLLDLWWNPTTEDQAIDRAHRIGQTRPVTVLRLTVKNTVEDRILALQQKKREMVASAFGEDENGGRQTRLTVEDLNYLFMV